MKDKQTCSHKVLSNETSVPKNTIKKVRINMNKYGHLLNPLFSTKLNTDTLTNREIPLADSNK